MEKSKQRLDVNQNAKRILDALTGAHEEKKVNGIHVKVKDKKHKSLSKKR